jgi:polyphosphate glucokinase
MNVLVIDVGGTHVKILATGQSEKREFASGPKMTAEQMIPQVQKLANGWDYDVVSMGYPGPVLHNRPVADPKNLGPGWMGFDFKAGFGRPTKVLNDAAMQALGSYRNGKMLFLGLGTGLGSTLILDGVLEPMELGHLPYKKATYEDYVGARGLERFGKKRWRKHVFDVVDRLAGALEPDDIVLGGGNAKILNDLPPRCRVGDNANAFKGGFLMWEDAPTSSQAAAHQIGPAVVKKLRTPARSKRA